MKLWLSGRQKHGRWVDDTRISVDDTRISVDDTLISVVDTLISVDDIRISVDDAFISEDDTRISVDWNGRGMMVNMDFWTGDQRIIKWGGQCLLEEWRSIATKYRKLSLLIAAWY